jgi:hypothetical protein
VNRKVLGGVSALAVGVVGTGVYLAVPASAGGGSPSPSASAKQKPGQQNKQQRLKKRAMRAGVHGQATVRRKDGFVQVSWQRGQVTAKKSGTVSVRSLDGTTWQWHTDGKTRVRKDGQKSALADLAVKDFVVLTGTDASGAHTAKLIVVPKKVPAKATQSPAPSHS